MRSGARRATKDRYWSSSVFDIFGAGAEIVRSRFPQAIQVTLENSGHVHWLQNPAGYDNALGEFYEHAHGSV